MNPENPTPGKSGIYRAYYRETENGGVNKTFVFRVESGEPKQVKPTISIRSKTGNHGWDEWRLSNGFYIIISVSRPNNPNTSYTVEVRGLYVMNNKATWGKLFTEETMKLNIKDIIEKVKQVIGA